MDNQSYTWTDNPTVSGVSPCNTDVLNECLMHLKYNQPTGDGFRLFDIKITDRKLIGEEAVGWVIQGGLVTMTYPDAVNQIIEEFDEGVTTTYRGISCVQSLTGHYIADISKKSAIDKLFSQTGIADFYILDKTNRQFYLPRNKWFMQLTTDDTKINQFNEAGLPNHQHSPIYLTGSNADLGDPGDYCMTNAGQSNGVRTCADSRTGNVSNNSLYGKSSTVQPQSSNKLLYYKVGNVTTGVGEILIDAQEFLSESTQQLENTAQDGLNDIETAINDGVSAISNVSNALKQNQITNCLLEVPQRVKVELNDGSLTLKAGSVVIVPYGTEAPTMEIGDTLNGGEIVGISWDGSKLFYFVKYGSDINYSYSPSSTYEDVVCISTQGTCLSRGIDNNFSGDTAPVVTHAYNTWYDTANNIMKWTDTAGSVWNEYCSFPFCTAMVEKNVGFNYIKNIFNGVGFIGSAFWIDKGVKGLAPNGRNADGTLRNLEIETQYIYVNTDIGIGSNRTLFFAHRNYPRLYSMTGQYEFIQSQKPDYHGIVSASWYNPSENKYYLWRTDLMEWEVVNWIKLGWFGTTDSGNYTRIAEFNSSQKSMPFQALDYNDAEFIAHQAMPSGNTVTLSLPASNVTLTATADGYAVINATTTSMNGMVSLNIVNSANGKKVLQDLKKPSSSGALMATSLPVAKGDLIQVGYQDISLNFFQFVYANGAI